MILAYYIFHTVNEAINFISQIDEQFGIKEQTFQITVEGWEVTYELESIETAHEMFEHCSEVTRWGTDTNLF
jgi:ABC-type long-subunit fatty acid transport system fused permease/ATPase subunit